MVTEDTFANNPILDHYEKKIYDQNQLLEISKALNSTLDYNYLIDAILNTCLAQLQTLKSAIYLAPDVDANYFKLSKGGFEISGEEADRKIYIDSPFLQHFEEKSKATSIQSMELVKHLQKDPDLIFFKNIGAEIIVPMVSKGKINGFLLLGEKITMSEFLDAERDFLTTLASLAGVAVDNARLYELATVDMMTQLKVHHYFQSKLREEMDRCRKKKSKCALLFTDVDKFKTFNDTYGHQAGDVVLIAVAKKLIESCRKNDIAARYGGEEFCIIMPNASIEEGYEMGEKVRKAIESTVVINPNTGQELKVTISVGVSEFNVNDKNNKDLIERADRALYKAKHGGRNKTITMSYEEAIAGT